VQHALIFLWIVEPGGNVAARVEYAPYVDIVVPLNSQTYSLLVP
jgi:hypothetical protein